MGSAGRSENAHVVLGVRLRDLRGGLGDEAGLGDVARAKPEGRAGPEDIAKARLIAEAAKEVSQPDS